MADELTEGRTLVRTNLWRVFAVSAAVSYLAARFSPANATASWARLAAVALMCLLVYRGMRPALWILAVMTGLAGAAMVAAGVVGPGLHWTDRVLFGGAGLVQIVALVILTRAPEARAFMRAQRERLR